MLVNRDTMIATWADYNNLGGYRDRHGFTKHHMKVQNMDNGVDLRTVREVEQLAMHAWPGLETEELNGWLLRHASGITRRANSVWPNEAGGAIATEENLAQVENFYHTRGLPARFQICPAAQPAGLDEILEQRSYRAVAKTAVQITSNDQMLKNIERPSYLEVEVSPQPSEAWWHGYATADDVTPESVAARQAICAHITPATAYASVMHNGEVIAVGSAAVEVGWIGYFNIATLPKNRRMGAAQALMRALGEWGKRMGASKGYLQVMTNNEAALRLYARLGFETLYHYHYREETKPVS